MKFKSPIFCCRLFAGGGFARQFFGATSGTILVKFAVLAPVLLLTTLFTIEFSMAVRQKAMLQNVVDAASLAAAKELSLSVTKSSNIPDVVATLVESLLLEHGAKFPVPVLTTVVRSDPLEVDVTAKQALGVTFGGVFGVKLEDISLRSVARVVGSPNICVLGLEPNSAGAISLQRDARVTGRNCAIFSNSKSPQGIKSKANARLTAKLICSAGGRVGGKANFDPAPIVDCPQFEDPLIDRPAPVVGACNFGSLEIEDQTRSILPGTYCGDLTIEGSSKVTMRPGVYVIKGKLRVEDSAELKGEGVGIYLAGANSRFQFDYDTTIELTAPTGGGMAGLLIFGSRSQNGNVKNEIMSNNARVLLGTIYLPRARLTIGGKSPIAAESAYTAIVAMRIEAGSSPNLVLNTNYDETDVPVPAGIRGAGQPVALVE